MDNEKLDHIAHLIEEGYYCGICPTWSIEVEEDENEEEIRLQEIARLIREGYRSGFDPSWSLDISEDED